MSLEKFYQILLSDTPSIGIKENEEYIFSLIPELKCCKGFHQNNPWHIYDVYEHILHVVDGVSNNLTMRLAALFHDVGKPYTYTEDEQGIGHFYNHWIKSKEIFLDFAKNHSIAKEITECVAKLIFYHDVRIEKVSEEILLQLVNSLTKEEINLLFELKRSDLLAQNPEHHDQLLEYEKQKTLLLHYYNRGDLL